MKRVFLAALAIAAVVGCTKNDSVGVATGGEVKFTSVAIPTRTDAAAAEWDAEDVIGVSMYENGVTASAIKANVPYEVASINPTSGAAVFDAVSDVDDDKLFYPQTVGTTVDFYAYAPFVEGLTTTTYAANVASQTTNADDLGAIDFIWAAPLTAQQKSETAKAFTFTHRLSKLVLNITPKSGVKSLTDLKVVLSGANTEADFDLLTGVIDATSVDAVADITLNTTETKSGDKVTKVVATALLIPETLGADAELTFTFTNADGEMDSFSTPFNGKVFESSKSYSYVIEVGYTEAEFVGESTLTSWNVVEDNNSIDTEEVYKVGDIYPNVNNPMGIVGSDDADGFYVFNFEGMRTFSSEYKDTVTIEEINDIFARFVNSPGYTFDIPTEAIILSLISNRDVIDPLLPDYLDPIMESIDDYMCAESGVITHRGVYVIPVMKVEK